MKIKKLAVVFLLLISLITALFLCLHNLPYAREYRKDEADKAEALEKITFVDGKKTEVKLYSPGEVIAKPEEINAYATFKVDKTLQEQATEVRGNLLQNGYQNSIKPVSDTDGSDINSVVQHFTGASYDITVVYYFADMHTCPEKTICSYSGYRDLKRGEVLYDVNQLALVKVDEVEVTLSTKGRTPFLPPYDKL